MRPGTRGRPHTLCIAAALLAGLWSGGCAFDERGLAPDGGAHPADARSDGSAFADARPDASPTDPDAMTDNAGVLFSTRTTHEPSLDGYTDEWSDARWRTFDISDAPEYWIRNTSYSDSATIEFASMHDAVNIYFFIAVSDDQLTSDSYDIWRDDAITLFIDAAGDRSGPRGYDDHEIAIGEDNTYADYAMPGVSDITLGGIVADSADGYNIEIRIRKNTLGASPLPDTLGFTISISDDDGLDDADVDCYAPWYVAPGPHCTECCSGGPSYPWCDTTLLGQLVLL